MFRWIANLFTTKTYVTYEEQADALEESIFTTQRAAIRELETNGQTEAFHQIMGQVELLKGQLASTLAKL